MAWKQTGQPTVQKQRDKWVVRVDGIDTESGRRRPRQVGTFPSRRAAQTGATGFAVGGAAAGDVQTVGDLVDAWVEGKVDVARNSLRQYEWAARHIRTGLGGIRADRLERKDVARWLNGLAADGNLSRRSIQIFRTVLRAALADAVELGELRRSPAARVGLPRNVVDPGRRRVVEAWTEQELSQFLDSIADHRWAGPVRLAALYGLRRSELLGLQWSAVDLRKRTVRINKALVEVKGPPEWSDGKNARSRRIIPIDASMAKALGAHRRFQAEERLAAGARWQDHDLVVATRDGRPVSPRNFDQTLERLVKRAGVPRLTSHGLRHTAATHMVKSAADIGEIRAAADILGHSPDMMMRTYAHALPESVSAVTEKIGRRGAAMSNG